MIKKVKAISCLALVFLFSCSGNHNNQSEESMQAHKDSIRIADSIRTDSIRTAREIEAAQDRFRDATQKSIDSLQARIDDMDKIYGKSKAKGHEQWVKEKAAFESRIDRLKEQQKKLGKLTRNEWEKFKMETDTTFSDFKQDWNTMMDKMKFKK